MGEVPGLHFYLLYKGVTSSRPLILKSLNPLRQNKEIKIQVSETKR